MMENEVLRRFTVLAIATVAAAADPAAGANEAPKRNESTLREYPVFQPVRLPETEESSWLDVLLGPEVFSRARHDLGDLRLFNAAGRAVPYALRVLETKYRRDAVPANTFNRSVGPDGSREISLDLSGAGEHNEVEINTPGREFRRRVVLEGSDDREEWKQLADEFLTRFEVEEVWLESKSGPEKPEPGRRIAEDRWLSYPPSRFRYLRVRVFQDPETDSKPVDDVRVTVRRTVAIPGERITHPAELGQREPARADRAAASAWMLDLGGEAVPVSRLTVEIEDSEFVRNYRIKAGPPAEEIGPFTRFRSVTRGVWRRRAGEDTGPMVANFREVRAARLRLTIVDHGNPPLNVQSARYSAAARQVVFARDEVADSPKLRLYYGNPDGLPPAYDFARNLPAELKPPPNRGSLGPRKKNPQFVPEPKPFTERWPGAIYAVLASVSVLLAGIVFAVGRRAIVSCEL